MGAEVQRDLYAARDVLVARYLQPTGWRALAAFPRIEHSIAVLASASSRVGLGGSSLPPWHVHGVGIGGRNDGDEAAVVVFVTRKLPAREIPEADRVPDTIDGVRTDVVESRVPRLAACTDTRRGEHRPLIGGVSVGRRRGPSGTIGAFARSTRAGDSPDDLLLLSNSHVLSPPGGGSRRVGIVQPSTDDGSGRDVGALLRATRLTATKPIAADAAVARLDDPSGVRNEVCGIGAIAGTGEPRKDSRVEKHGRTTGHSVGIVKVVGLAAEALDASGRRLQFRNVFRVEREPGSQASLANLGDSGSLVLEQGQRIAVGLLYAADQLETFYLAQPIEDVCRELEIEIKLG